MMVLQALPGIEPTGDLLFTRQAVLRLNYSASNFIIT